MNLPSLTKLRKQALTTFKRFPLAIISAIIATAAYICLVEFNEDEIFYIAKMTVVAMLGIPLFTVIPLIAEKKKWNISIRAAVAFLGVALLFGYYFLLPDKLEPTFGYIHYRYILYFVGLHFLVAVGPYWNKNQIHSFWHYNKTLFLRILTAALFSAVLFLGLAAALGSVQILFQVDINFDWYQELFLVIAGIFNTWFFLAGIPKPIQKLGSVSSYPKGLKIFARNVLLPLVAIYMIILYVYAGMIIIRWEWPQGWVSMLILFFSIFGILAILLLYPLRNKTDNQWVKRFSKLYYWILFPLTIFLLLAIWRRVSEYGFTVERYFVFILGLWLLGLVIYFIFSKKQNIKIIPASLCIIAFVISFGPWGAFSVSEQSQTNRLKNILKRNNILQNGTIHKADQALARHDKKQISSILRYLNQTHGLNSIQPWFQQDLTHLSQSVSSSSSARPIGPHDRPQKVAQLMGIKYVRSYEMNDTKTSRHNRSGYFSMDQKIPFPIAQYQTIATDIYLNSYQPASTVSLSSGSFHVRLKADAMQVVLQSDSTNFSSVVIPVKNKLIQLIETDLVDSRKIAPQKMAVTASNARLDAKIYIQEISWTKKDTKYTINFIRFDLLLSFK